MRKLPLWKEQIEVENNQVAIGRTVTGPQNVPQGMGGYFGEQRQKGDGVTADPATVLDPTIKPNGSLIHPLPDAKTVGDWITAIIPDDVKDLVDHIFSASNENDARRTNPSKADSPVWQGLRPSGNGVRTDGDRLYEWDYTHNKFEVYDKRGRHLGSADPVTGELYKPAVPGRKLNR